MAAARATANRKPPAFKPPRPTQKTMSKETSRRLSASSPEVAESSRISKPQSKMSHGKSRPGFRPASRSIQISDDEDTEDEEDEDQDALEIEDHDSNDSDVDTSLASRRRLTHAPASPSAIAPPPASQEAVPPIPQKLLVRLLHEGFDNESTKIGKDAMAVVGKYVELFVREAIARAAVEREGQGGSGLNDGFLETEDLEKLAPQLILDF